MLITGDITIIRHFFVFVSVTGLITILRGRVVETWRSWVDELLQWNISVAVSLDLFNDRLAVDGLPVLEVVSCLSQPFDKVSIGQWLLLLKNISERFRLSVLVVHLQRSFQTIVVSLADVVCPGDAIDGSPVDWPLCGAPGWFIA